MRLWETPVPMPNTMVKTYTADDTWWETAWESRWLPESIAGCSVAWLARLIWDQEVAGSNPVTPTLTFLVSPVAEGKTVGFIYCKIKSNIGIICISSSAG